ncbi:Uncharacterised protein [Bacteroides xylanisolvens]|nr:Uncharacterised protein [Bacteroides xylanisolvens]
MPLRQYLYVIGICYEYRQCLITMSGQMALSPVRMGPYWGNIIFIILKVGSGLFGMKLHTPIRALKTFQWQ